MYKEPKARGQPISRKGGGFTLLELIIALGIVAIVSGGLFLAFRQTERSALRNAALMLQADIRYAQRRAITEGRTVRILLEPRPGHDRDRYVVNRGQRDSRIVYFENGINIMFRQEFHFLPRGTPGGDLYTIVLRSERYQQNVTVGPVGGRVDISPTIRPIVTVTPTPWP